jgi:hypothetical protein
MESTGYIIILEVRWSNGNIKDGEKLACAQGPIHEDSLVIPKETVVGQTIGL